MQPTKYVGMCRPTNLFWDQPLLPWIIKLDLTGKELLKFSTPKFRKLPNNHTSFTNFSPSGFYFFFSGCAKKSGENSLEAGITPKKRWTTRNRQPLAAPRPTKIHGLQSLQRASCGKKRCQRARDHTHPWTQVAFRKSHSSCTTRFFKHVPKLGSITSFLLTFKLAFFWYISK